MGRGTLILVTTYKGQASFAELDRMASAGERPRREYVRLAEELGDPVVLDYDYLTTRAHGLARMLARASVPLAQLAEALLSQRRFAHVVALSDRLGLPLALAFKLTRSRRDLVLVSDWLTPPKKAVFLRRLRVHTHIGAIVQTNTLQRAKAREELGVPEAKLVLTPWAVDTRFWRPLGPPTESEVCAVGWEQRDYATLLEAVRGLPTKVHLALGTMVLSPPAGFRPGGARPSSGPSLEAFDALRHTAGYRAQERWVAGAGGTPLPDNVVVHTQLGPTELRRLYARSRFVVLPLHQVDYDAGATTVTEAMAMGRAVVVTGIQGQTDYVRHFEDGLYVRPYDVTGLREAMLYLLEHPEVAEDMGRAGRRRAEERFSIDTLAARLRRVVVDGPDGVGDGDGPGGGG